MTSLEKSTNHCQLWFVHELSAGDFEHSFSWDESGESLNGEAKRHNFAAFGSLFSEFLH